MKRILYSLLIMLLTYVSNAQVFIQPGAGVKTTNNVQLSFANIDVINNDPTADFSTSNLVFKGNNNTLLGGSISWQLRTIIIDKQNATLSLNNDLFASDKLLLVNGKLDLNNRVITLAPGATLEGETESNRIIGPNGGMIKTSLSLNMPSAQNPGKLGAIISSNQNLGTVIVKRWHKEDNNTGKVYRFYEITPTNNTNLNATLRLQYLDAELNGINESTLGIFQRTSNSSTWVASLAETINNTTENYLQQAGITSFQQYSLGIKNVVVPLVWGPVQAKCKKGVMEVKWTTLQENSLKEFRVQRSTSGNQWTTVTTIAAIGNSSSTTTYTYNDLTAPAGDVLYQIMSVDIDGSTGYSPVVTAKSCSKQLALTLAPVPAQNETTLFVNSTDGYKSDGSNDQLIYKLISSEGKSVLRKTVKFGMNTSIKIGLQGLPNGSYYLQVQLPDGTSQTLSLLKQ